MASQDIIASVKNSQLPRQNAFQQYINERFRAFSGVKSLSLLRSNTSSDLDSATIVSEFALILSTLRVPGPADLMTGKIAIGHGGQSTISRQDINGLWGPGHISMASNNEQKTVAVKIPHFQLDKNSRTDLSNPKVRLQVREMILEITALCHPKLRGHRNIVDLMAWGTSNDEWQEMPFLALELANKSLFEMLYDWEDMPIALKHHVSLDIGHALDAIHDVGLVHGDLKPDNVLMFYHDGIWTAKLADFAGAGDLAKDITVQGRGTLGWRAPEFRTFLEDNQPLDLSDLGLIDSYAYGLIIWTIFCQVGGLPPCDEEDVALPQAQVDLERNRSQLPETLYGALKIAFDLTLALAPCERTSKVGHLLNEGSSIYRTWANLSEDFESVDQHTYESSNAEDSLFDWEIPEVSRLNAEALRAVFLKDNGLSPDMSYALALKYMGHGRRILKDESARDILLRLVTSAAQQNNMPSQSLVHHLYGSLQQRMPAEVATRKLAWQSDAVANGAFFLADELNNTDTNLCTKSLQIFHALGGYNRFYAHVDPATVQRILHRPASTIIQQFEASEALNSRGDRLMHLLASTDYSEALSKLLSVLTVEEINSTNNVGETPLYRACMAGNASNVLSLLSSGADPSLAPQRNGLTCLHWLFHFERSDIDSVAENLILRGSTIDAICSESLPMLYYPFKTPTGTPLHWAVHMAAREAVSALLRHNANPAVRDGSDPYAYDRSVRVLDMSLQPDLVHYSISEGPTLGLTSIDVAVQHCDHEILDLLLSNERSIHRDDVDEEGYTALHRLSTSEWCHTKHGSAIWKPLVRGSREAQRRGLEQTVAILVKHGFGLDRLTKPSVRAQKPEFYGQTALMLAVATGQIDVMEVLLDAGAKVDIVNAEGRTAMLSISDDYGRDEEQLQSRIVSLLLANNANTQETDINGYTALLGAAAYRLQGAVDALLSHGANIYDRVTSPTSLNVGWNVFAALAQCELSEAASYDKWLSSILVEHLLPLLASQDSDKARNELIEKADLNDGSLLHYFTSNGLIQSSTLLLEQGAQVNALQKAERYRYRDQRWLRIISYHTPLDIAMKSLKRRRRHQERRYSEKEVDKQMAVFGDIIRLLEGVGATRAKSLTTKHVVPCDGPPRSGEI